MTRRASSPSVERLRLPQLMVGTVGADEIRLRRVAARLEQEGISVISEGSDAKDFLTSSRVTEVDAVVIFCDFSRPIESRSLIELRRALPATALIAVVLNAAVREARAALAAHVDGVVFEERLEQSLGLAIRSACAGQLSLPQELRAAVVRPSLSPREKQVLGMVVMGFMNGEIAAQLCIVEATVKSHLSSAFTKLGVRSRTEAAELILDEEGGLGTGILAISGAERGMASDREP